MLHPDLEIFLLQLSVSGFKTWPRCRAQELMSCVQGERFSMSTFTLPAWLGSDRVISLRMEKDGNEKRNGRKGAEERKAHKTFKPVIPQVDGTKSDCVSTLSERNSPVSELRE